MDSSTDEYNSDDSTILEAFDIKNTCRTCMSKDTHMKNIFDNDNIEKRIQFCTGLKLIMSDYLSSLICNVCVEKLTTACNFKKRCLEIHRKLQEMFTEVDTIERNRVFLSENNDFDSSEMKHEDTHAGDYFVDDDEKELVDDKEGTMNKDVNFVISTCSPEKDDKVDQNAVKKNSLSVDQKTPTSRALFCGPCDMKFQNKKDFENHKNNVHKMEAWVCQHCGKTSSKKSAYYYHMNFYHKNKDSGNLDAGRTQKSSKVSKRLGVKRGPYKKKNGGMVEESVCGSAPDVVEKRARRKFKLNKQFCEKCNVKFTDEEEFIAHKRDVHKHVYLCEICGRVFYNRDARFSHMTSHERPKFACDHCDYSTTRKQDLVKHLYVHNGVKRYQCEYCPLSFYTTSNLHNHARRHRDGPNVCTVCNKKIYDRYSFKRHMDAHNGNASNAQFACKLCGSCFRRRSRLNQHMLKRHNVKMPPQRPGRRKIESSNVM